MTSISFPESTQGVKEEAIIKVLGDSQFSALFDIDEENNRIGFTYLIGENAKESVKMQAANISSLLAGLFLLPDDIFESVMGLANSALLAEASKNPEFREKLDMFEGIEDQEYLI